MSTDKKPIGWWVKRVDRLLEESFERVLTGDRLTRRHWQVLNTVGAGAGAGVGRAELDERLAPFWPADAAGRAAEIGALLGHLERLGWIRNADPVALTPAGEAVRGRIEAAVVRTRERVIDGIGPEQYRQVVDTLARMADNLS